MYLTAKEYGGWVIMWSQRSTYSLSLRASPCITSTPLIPAVLRLASSTAPSFTSIPTALLQFTPHASSIEPEPQNGSTTSSPLLVYILTSRSHRPRGRADG